MGLSKQCPGNAAERNADGSINYGGRAQQLRRLRQGTHPTTGQKLPTAIPEYLWPSSSDFENLENVDVDADIPILTTSSVGRMRLRLRAREARAHGTPEQLMRCQRIEDALRGCMNAQQQTARTDEHLPDPTLPDVPALTEHDVRLLSARLPVPPIYPPGHGGAQPAEWDREDQEALNQWIMDGRPEVILEGLPAPGVVYHPWVQFTGLLQRGASTASNHVYTQAYDDVPH